MPSFCVVDGCKSSSNMNKEKNAKHIKFVTFPRNCEVRNLWVKACANKNVNTKTGRICSLHFTDDDWRLKDILLNTPIEKRYLKPTAVPSIMMPEKKCKSAIARENRAALRHSKQLVKSALQDYDKRIRILEQEESDCSFYGPMDDEVSSTSYTIPPEFYSMDPIWKRWCRLCSKENGDQIEVLVKDEEVSDLSATISKHFLFNITPFDDLPKMICNSCHKFVTSLDLFYDRTTKVQLMYNEIQFDNNVSTVEDLKILRNKFGITVGEFEYSSNNSELLLNDLEDMKEDSPKPKFSTNPLEPDLGMAEFQYLEMGYLDVKIVKEENITDTDNNGDELEGNLTDENIEDIEILDPVKDFENSDNDNDYDNDNDNDNDSDSMEYSPKTKKSCFPTTSTANKSKSTLVSKPNVDENNTNLNCDECSKSFKREPHYRLHMKNVHEIEINPPVYACSKCDKVFSTQKRLENHEYTHLPLEMKLNVPCPYCDKKFTKEVSVKSHIKSIHMNEKPFICEECGKAFKTIGALKEHKFTHVEESPFQCSHCEKTFKNKARLKTHEDTHNDTIYVCTICGLQLNTRRTLKMHMLVHSDQKRHKCHYCGNEFKRAKALKNHLILHTGLKPYTCNFCDKTFANGSNCRSHKKKTHPEELAAMEAAGAKTFVTNMPKLEQLRAVAAVKPLDSNADLKTSKPESLMNLNNLHENIGNRSCEITQEKTQPETMGLYVFDSLS